jgi:hypothetical protein
MDNNCNGSHQLHWKGHDSQYSFCMFLNALGTIGSFLMLLSDQMGGLKTSDDLISNLVWSPPCEELWKEL